MSVLRSRDNARVRRWHALAHDRRARQGEGSALIEGAHLLAAYLDAGLRPELLILSESALESAENLALVKRAERPMAVLGDALFRWMGDAVNPTGLAAEIPIPRDAEMPATCAHAVFLDGVQDAGNVGAILRSAAAFGVEAAVLGPGCADPWSPKVLRAAMGGHFVLQIAQVPSLADALDTFRGQRLCALPSGGVPPDRLDLRGAVGWILGGEGQGVSTAAAGKANGQVSVPLAQGTESLNVAAAAAILFYERARQLSTGGARS